MDRTVTVWLNAAVPMGLIRLACGRKFRDGEREGAKSKATPDETVCGFRGILTGPNDLVSPIAWVLYKSSKKGQLAEFHFNYQIKPKDVAVCVESEDTIACLQWYSDQCKPVQ